MPEPGGPQALVLDAIPLFRLALSTVLAGVGVPTVHEVEDVSAALAIIRRGGPDIFLAGDAGDDLVELMRAVNAAPSPPRTMLLLATASPDRLRPLLSCGVAAVLVRSVVRDELATAVTRVLAGDRVVSGALLPLLFESQATGGPQDPTVEVLPAEPVAVGPGAVAVSARVGSPALTAKEHTIVRLLAAGQSNGEIAETLFVSPATVKTHLAHIYRKLDARGRHEALVRAAGLGLLG